MKRLILAAAAAAGLGHSACADVPQVVTDIAPVHSLVAQVMGEIGTPQLLIDGAADPHSFQLKPSQARGLANADLFIWVGPELTPSLERAVEGTGVKGEALALLGHVHDGDAPHHDEHHEEDDHHEGHHGEDDHHGEAHDEEAHDDHHEGTAHDDHAGADHGEDAHESHDHDNHDEGGHDEGGHDHGGLNHGGHDHGGVDPHAWLDPMIARDWLEEIALHLGELDPANAAAYAANALAAQSRIDAMMVEIEALLKDRDPGPVLVLHDAYGHFTERFGIEVLGSLKAGDHAAPSAAQIKALRDQVAARPVACIFGEPQQDDRLIRAVTEGSDIAIGMLDPTGATLQPGPNLYEALILSMATSFATCGAGR
ncbi:High-affinity zinc uptake system protein ZnuA precursor [Pseudoruegeria aquimaris]|uniref:High-affinity zinc uptake system protein ZnuA n=1 Tax=Pseudoruegeria aquimaris TaxID=393663 RepID=A0A1Y5TCA4_9RHOB|nr:zinc ABC transporter substrate-binding protein [Pseudoruegeria aquimaris]SLN60792.1 High-affinity zinc uptake system protein ZnuA precursor [Pseudoruegeria aquimaris]